MSIAASMARLAGGIDAVDALAVAFQLAAFETPAAAPTMAASAATRGSPSWSTPTGEQQHGITRPLLRPAAAPPGGYGTSGITAWIQDNVVTVVILLAACAVLGAARSGNIGKGITITAGLILGVAVLGLATGATATDIGDWLVHLVRSS